TGAVQLKLAPSDSFGPGPTLVTDAFAYGNDAPVIVSLIVDSSGGVVRGNAVVRFVAADSAGDNVSIAKLEYSKAGDFTDGVALSLTVGPSGSFPGGVLSDLHTTTSGVEENVTWASAADRADSASVRLTISDSYGALSQPLASAPFKLRNLPALPSINVTS